jgi:CRISPR system Cascade subunit CasA
VAILQDSLRPQNVGDLKQIWHNEQFSSGGLAAFGEKYAHRFDLFSEEAPFMQSADLPRFPCKKDKTKPVGYLLSEQPAGTAVTHYTHVYDDAQQFCSHCAAKGLVTIPAFASSGGAGIKPSINGVPPIYVLPGGETLFESLAASLTIPRFQPGRSDADQPWWEHKSTVAKKAIVKKVGYLHSLTFPARRVRLHPIAGHSACTRCGQRASWHVKTMIYEMGESRPKEAAWWRDPFAAYRKPKNSEEVKHPNPIRPVAGRPVWREFTGLFLPTNVDYRPAILNQLESLRNDLPYAADVHIPLRVISLRTDMKMKIFEWQESGFAVPPNLLSDIDSAKYIEDGIEFAVQCEGIIKKTFRQYFGGGGKSSRYESVVSQMSRRYWQELGQAFQLHVQRYVPQADLNYIFQDWLQTVISQASHLFEEATASLPDDGATLRQQVEANNHCRAKLYSYRNKNYPQEETA